MDDVYSTNPKKCMTCHYEFDSHSGIPIDDESPRPPEKGDYSVCLNCGVLAEFDADLNLVALTADQLSELMLSDIQLYNILNRASLYILQRNKLKE